MQMKAVKSNSDPEWGAVLPKEGWVLTGVCLNGFFSPSRPAVLRTKASTPIVVARKESVAGMPQG